MKTKENAAALARLFFPHSHPASGVLAAADRRMEACLRLHSTFLSSFRMSGSKIRRTYYKDFFNSASQKQLTPES